MLFENSDFYWAIFWRLQCLKHKIGFASGGYVSVSWYWPCCLDISKYKDTTKQSNAFVRLRGGGCFCHVAFYCPRASKCCRGSPIVLGAAVGVIFGCMSMLSIYMQIKRYIGTYLCILDTLCLAAVRIHLGLRRSQHPRPSYSMLRVVGENLRYTHVCAFNLHAEKTLDSRCPTLA